MNPIDRTEQLRARVAELEAALRKCRAFLNTWRDCLAGVQMTEAHFDSTSGVQEASAALARAESATPLPMREDPRYRGTDFRSALDVDRASQGGGK